MNDVARTNHVRKKTSKNYDCFSKKISTNVKAKTQRFAESLYFLTHVMLAFLSDFSHTVNDIHAI